MFLRGRTIGTALPIWAAAWCAASLYGQTSVLTWHNDSARTGQNLQETILTPANVNASTFGRLFVIPVDGKVDAQPLYVPAVAFPGIGTHNALYVVTEHDSAYAFDADNGALLWHVSLARPNETPSDDRGCSQVTPEIGITATPVIDAQSGPFGTMYLVAMSKDASGNYHQRLHALDLTTGGEEFGGPAEIKATYPGSGTEGSGSLLTFDPKQHKERPALVIVNGIVYTSWGSHCDFGPYTGWLIGYSESTLQQSSVLNLVPNGGDGGIWAAGAGPAADSNGNLYMSLGNGSFDATLNSGGFPKFADYGNAFVKISTGGATPTVTDYFTMSNTRLESNADSDLGSGGLILLPTLSDAQGQPLTLAVAGGKDQNIYVVDQGNMGKFDPNRNHAYQQLVGASIFSTPAWFNGTLYYGMVGSPLQAFAFANGQFGRAPVSQSANVFGYPGTTPSISASGTSNAIVWAAENASTAVLHAYDARDLASELYNSNQAANGRDHFGQGNKYIVPTVVNGKVYVGTTAGVGVFGLLGQTPPPPAPQPSSVANSATAAPGPIAPGELVTIKGSSLGPADPAQFTVNPVTGMVDSLLAGTRVFFGGLAAPILYTSATQVNAIVPWEVAGQGQIVVQVENQGVRSAPVTIQAATTAPGVFTFNGTGAGQAAAENLDGSLNGPSNPASAGGYVSVYFTGGGQTTPPGITGSITGGTLEWLAQHVSATVGNVPATVSFAGAVPTLVSGVGVLNLHLADDTPRGSAQPVVIIVDGVASPSTATLAIQ